MTSSGHKKISIIIPVYNEARTVLEVIERVEAVPLDLEKEIIVVDDGSTDGTAEALRALRDQGEMGTAGKAEKKFIFCEKNQGKGAMARKGIESATGDIVLFQDADLELDPAEYPRLIEPILSGKAKVVYGSRNYLSAPGVDAWSKIGNLFLSALTSALYGRLVPDMETAYKVFDRRVLGELNLKASGFEFEPELTAKTLRSGARIYPVPIDYRPRRRREGKKIRWTDGVKAVWFLCKYRVAPMGRIVRRERPRP